MYIVHIIPIPHIKLWGREIYDMLQTLYIGILTLCNGKGGNDIVSFANYGDVGFGIDIGHQLVPLMRIGNRGSPSIGFGSTMACHFALVVSCFGLGSPLWCEGEIQGLEGMVACSFTVFDGCFMAHSAFILLMLRSVSLLQVTGMAR